tara:strand:- start:290 stop:490 length:201 start_codon:yes stop_codon:yes gene_type:complete
MRKILILVFLALLGCKGVKIKQPSTKPNVLLLYIDDLRPELAGFGAKQIISPNIDALASKGVKFLK